MERIRLREQEKKDRENKTQGPESQKTYLEGDHADYENQDEKKHYVKNEGHGIS